MKRLTVAAGGNAAIVILMATDVKDYDSAQGVEAIVVSLDPGAPGARDAPGAPPGNARSL